MRIGSLPLRVGLSRLDMYLAVTAYSTKCFAAGILRSIHLLPSMSLFFLPLESCTSAVGLVGALPRVQETGGQYRTSVTHVEVAAEPRLLEIRNFVAGSLAVALPV